MKFYLYILLLTLALSCSKNSEDFIEHIEGYWEIKSVTLANGTIKHYKVSQTIDYITINDSLKGFRKKMTPRFDGKYNTSKSIENLQLELENDSLNVYYTTEFAKWKETVIMASKDELKLINQNNHVYLYRRYTPIVAE